MMKNHSETLPSRRAAAAKRPRTGKTAAFDEPSVPSIRRKLLRWYRENGRDLPWRKTTDPYRIWISEVMLQQTRVETVLPYYKTFLKRFPTVQALAKAPQDDVLKTWENLGYYSRARHLHKAAQIVAERFGGRLSGNVEDLRELPGVGGYTAGAIASIAFGKAVPAVDGNARRVLMRLFAVTAAMDRPSTVRLVQTLAEKLVPESAPGDFNQALMDLANSPCTPRKPACSRCPLEECCRARREGTQEAIPRRPKRGRIPERLAVAALIRDRKGRLLVVQRPEKGLLSALWKLPGGFLREGESPAEGLIRTVREEVGVESEPQLPLGTVRHSYTHFHMILHVFAGRIVCGRPRPPLGGEMRWSAPEDLASLAFSKAEHLAMSLAGMPRRNP
jgi:A/G-specific adenine glycosylase